MNKLKRYLSFLVGLFVNALGVSLITKASLGTSPISSIPYVLSLNFPLTLGNFTILFSLLLIVLQLIILRKDFKPEHILQIPVSIAFGYFIDLTMYLFFWVNPQNYLVKVFALLVGCLVLGFGVYLEVLADVVMLPSESFVRVVVQTWNTNFGTTKIIFASSMTILAGLLSFFFSGKLRGVREGTVIAALLVGFIARLLGKRLGFIKNYLFPETVSTANQTSAAGKEESHKNVIVIGRQYGCGGHDIRKALAEKLGYQFYDQEIIELIAGTTGMTSDFIRKREESMTNSLLYDFVNQMYLYGTKQEEAPKDKIFEAECQVVRNLAKKGNCVIVGRCADYVLRNSGNCLKVFFSAPLVSRIRRVAQRQNISEGEAKATVQKNEKLRADNYRYYTRRMWGAAGNFDLSLNTDLGEEFIENCIRSAMKL